MVKYTCPTCSKEFNRKSSFDDHLNKKNPCFPSQEKISYDILIKKIEELEKKSEKIEDLETKNNKIEKELKKLKKIEVENKEFKKEIKKLKKENTKLSTITNTTNSNNVTNSNNKTVNVLIMPKAFGNENLEFLDETAIRKILNKGYLALPEYIKNVHFNEKKPENHNVYIPNWRDKTRILVSDGENWNLGQTESIIDDLKNKGIEFIQRKYDELDKNNKEDARIIPKINRFIESYNLEEKDKIDTLNEEIMLVLYNNRAIPEKTRKDNAKKSKKD